MFCDTCIIACSKISNLINKVTYQDTTCTLFYQELCLFDGLSTVIDLCLEAQPLLKQSGGDGNYPVRLSIHSFGPSVCPSTYCHSVVYPIFNSKYYKSDPDFARYTRSETNHGSLVY